jgi:hypothetical protein
LNRRGVTLLECIISLFLLGGAIFLVISLFHNGLRRQNQIQQEARAAELAQLVANEIREFASSPTNYLTGLSAYRGREQSYPNFQGFLVRTEVGSPAGLTSPCSGLEGRFTHPRVLQQSTIPVKISVLWGANNTSSFSLHCQVREPKRAADSIRVSRIDSTGSPVPVNGILEFQAELLDTAGQPIPGVGFAWTVRPISGNATFIEPDSSDAQVGRFQHKYYFNPFTSDWENVPGDVRIEARARYWGEEFSGLSSVVVLQ